MVIEKGQVHFIELKPVICKKLEKSHVQLAKLEPDKLKNLTKSQAIPSST